MRCDFCGRKKCKCGAIEYYKNMNKTTETYVSPIPEANTMAFAFLQLQLRFMDVIEAIKNTLGL